MYDSITESIIQSSLRTASSADREASNKAIAITRDMVNSKFLTSSYDGKYYINQLPYESPEAYASKPKTYSHIVRTFYQEFITYLTQPPRTFTSNKYPDLDYQSYTNQLDWDKLTRITEVAGTSCVVLPTMSIWSREHLLPMIHPDTGELLAIGIDRVDDTNISVTHKATRSLDIYTKEWIRKYRNGNLIEELPNPLYPILPVTIFRASASNDTWWGDSDLQHYTQINMVVNNLLSQWSSAMTDQLTLGRIIISSEDDLAYVVDEQERKSSLNWQNSKLMHLPTNEARIERINVEGNLKEHLESIIELILQQYKEGQLIIVQDIKSVESGFSLLVRQIPFMNFMRTKQALYSKSLIDLTKKAYAWSQWDGTYDMQDKLPIPNELLELDPEWDIDITWDNNMLLPKDSNDITDATRVKREVVELLLEKNAITPELASSILLEAIGAEE